jgi:hypothetical protein
MLNWAIDREGDMEIEDARKAKLALEVELVGKLNIFQIKTGLTIEDIEFEQTSQLGGKKPIVNIHLITDLVTG